MVRFTGAPDWAEFFLSEPAPRLLAKIEERDGRWQIVRLIIDGDLDTKTLRELPYGRMESTINNMRPIETDGELMTPELFKAFHKRGAAPDFLAAEGRAIDKAVRAYLDKSAANPSPKLARGAPREPLGRPDGSDPDGFYRRVADEYTTLTMATRSPAKVIAAQVGVPVTTVHRWIREARSRGFLGPARKGRAG